MNILRSARFGVPQRAALTAAANLILVLAGCGGSGGGQTGSTAAAGSTNPVPVSSAGEPGAPDYSLAADWICRPGMESVCTEGLDATVQDADGQTTPQPFTPAANPAIDCFYVYPTESPEQTPYADLADSPMIQAIAKAQVGRLSSICRVFAPIYRQVTGYGLNHGTPITSTGIPMQDVQAAWDYYLKNDNQGRGVVLIGHSQGTILLQYLIAGSIDGTASQALLVSAFLAGDPSLAVPAGAAMGGTFINIPTCSQAAQTGCVYVWASYLTGDSSTPAFGAARGDGFESACVNPAAPSGGTGMLKPYFQVPKPPWLEAIGQITGRCQSVAGANVFVVTVEPGRFAAQDTNKLTANNLGGGWGLHPLDIALVQGNILDVLNAELATWKAQH
jgi:hypothetical protein